MTKYFHAITNAQAFPHLCSRAPLRHLSTEVRALWRRQHLACALTLSLVLFLLKHKGRLKQRWPLPKQLLTGPRGLLMTVVPLSRPQKMRVFASFKSLMHFPVKQEAATQTEDTKRTPLTYRSARDSTLQFSTENRQGTQGKKKQPYTTEEACCLSLLCASFSLYWP